jgi:cobalt-precorrin 5A hydrolase
MIVAGIGCRRLCPAEDIMDLVHQASAQAGRRATALAAPAFKDAEPGLHEAAARLGLPLLRVADAALRQAQPACPTRSPAAMRATGFASVAEAAALAAAGPGGRLVLARIANGRATCALAEGGAP